MKKFVYSDWEYHPIYGICTRIVYEKTGRDSLVMVGREYKKLAI